MSYDNVPEIRSMYVGFRRVPFDLGYSASAHRIGSELLIATMDLEFPRSWKKRIPDEEITAAAVRAKVA